MVGSYRTNFGYSGILQQDQWEDNPGPGECMHVRSFGERERGKAACRTSVLAAATVTSEEGRLGQHSSCFYPLNGDRERAVKTAGRNC